MSRRTRNRRMEESTTAWRPLPRGPFAPVTIYAPTSSDLMLAARFETHRDVAGNGV